MKLALVTIKDKKATGFSPIWTERNPAIAVRNFVEQCQTKGTQYNKFPEDYALVLIGEFETDTGEIKPYVTQSIDKSLKPTLEDKTKILAEAINFVNTEDK